MAKKDKLNLFLSIVLGCLVSLALIKLLDSLSMLALEYSIPDKEQSTIPGVWKTFMEGLGLSAKLSLIASKALAVLIGSLVAMLLFKGEGTRPGFFVGFIILLVSLINFITHYHPTWMIISSLLVLLPMAFFGTKLALRLRNLLHKRS